jgi:pimeloyl-ACP methyl ester carboxylesterase
MSMERYASDVFDLMIHLGAPTATVVGLSMGGYVALAMLMADPARLDGLVLADTRAAADGPDARAARDRMVDLVRRGGPPAVADEMLGKLLGETTRRERPQVVAAVRHLIESNGPDGIEAAILAMKHRQDHSLRLGTITCPTVVICGVEDGVTTAGECEAMSRQIPGGRFVRIEGAGHLSNLEAAEAFTTAIE